ncbi:MAG: LacI family DNA-binding transcriptional regulator [Candidatus Marinimicrobia bacterium]|nr:LacI family DNA-binding transcriptional regulator [FCB group bacterium]MBL7024373.1 LacI family DNA-binding transcriptional regulator [Candidatus Neomarinimicrobiota bacterium]
MNRKSPTLKDIANELGLSISTVSRALQDHAGIAEETITKVKKVAERFDYFPDSIAKNLKTNASRTIGVIVPEIKHDFFSSAIDGMEDLAYKHGFTIIVSKSNEDYNREVLNTHNMLSNRVAGIVASVSQTTQDGDHFRRFLRRGIPVVLFDRVLDNLDVSKVIVDDYEGAFKATQHLIEMGYRRISHLAGPTYLSIARERLRGYREALAKHNIEYDEEIVIHGTLEERSGTIGIKTLFELSDPPDAIFAINDPVAVGAHKEVIAMGLNIPADIGITGFSNNPITELIDPPLTTIDQHGYKMGQEAVQILMDELNTVMEKRKKFTRIVETTLIVRESTQRQIK